GAGEDTGGPPIVDKQVATQYKIGARGANTATYPERVIGWGRWLSFLYWQPFRAAAASHPLSLICNTFGWILIAVIAWIAVLGVLQRQWLWIALLMYSGALAVLWPIPNARYLVPVSFLLTLGIFVGVDEIGWRMHDARWRGGFAGVLGAAAAVIAYSMLSSLIEPVARREMIEQFLLPIILIAGGVVSCWLVFGVENDRAARWQSIIRWSLVIFVGGTVLCNLALYGLEVSVER